jgi:hypothetical protein
MKSARYNPPQRMMDKRCWAVALALVFLLPAARAANWEQPAGELAKQIAALAGPGPARLTIRNDSSLAASEIPPIRRLLEHDLRGFGVVTGGSESATQIRVTLSENLQGGLWVAEVVEGTETRVTMLPVSLGSTASPASGGASLTLRRTLAIMETDPVLDAQIVSAGNVQRLVVLEPERIVTYTRSAVGTSFVEAAEWVEDQRFSVAHTRPFPRDVQGELVPAQDHLFDAYLPGAMCSGTNTGAQVAVACGDSDDPWPVGGPIGSTQRAFYNSMRDSFTGVLAPGFGMEIAPFYQASDIPRPTGAGMLLNTLDGRVMLIENSTLKPVSGANDWGSDFAVVRSDCGSGVQVLVSGSGAAAAGDSLRAYEIVGREAIAMSASLPVDGVVTAVHAAGKEASAGTGATVIVRKDAPLRYEVWNVSAFCN